ncbi:MAG: acetate kinase [Anaerolineae bacterium]|nr:acetate kinase [Anaerolineae bacterium]MCB9104782.1 acetate kinase [Anaerolineales bacterium]
MILVINCGSSTIKYQLFSQDVATVTAKGAVAKIGEPGAYLDHQSGDQKITLEQDIPSHSAGFELIINTLLHAEYGAISHINEITAVGHRAVHGADVFVESTVIDDHVIENLEACVPLAPLHNPANLTGIRQARALLPNVPHVAVFDTAFHQTMPPPAYTYALPYELCQQHKLRRYGFHGTSFRYVSRRTAEVLHRPVEELKSVICHLGNGVSIAAVDGGKSVDTSLGFATFCGAMMGTRSGDFDPGLIFHLHNEVGMSLADIERMVFKESGLLGISGLSNDMRTIETQAAAGHARSQLALDLFAYMIKKYIGAYAAAMGGLNTLVFTAGIGENSPVVRQKVCDGLAFLGITIDNTANTQAVRGAERVISPPDAPVSVLVVPTNEEKMIALDTAELAALPQH